MATSVRASWWKKVLLVWVVVVTAWLASLGHAGVPKTFRRSTNLRPQDQPQRTFFPTQSFRRQRRNFRTEEDSSPFSSFPGFSAPSSSSGGSFRSGAPSFRGRGGAGARTFGGGAGGGAAGGGRGGGPSGPFPGFGGPDSFLQEEATTQTVLMGHADDDPHTFQFPGGVNFGNLRAPSGSGGGGGPGRKGGPASPTFTFPDGTGSFGTRDASGGFSFGGGTNFPGLSVSSQDLGSAAAAFGRALSEGGGNAFNVGGTDFNPGVFGGAGGSSIFTSGSNSFFPGGAARASSSSSSISSSSSSSSSGGGGVGGGITGGGTSNANPFSSFLTFPGAGGSSGTNTNTNPFGSQGISFTGRNPFGGGIFPPSPQGTGEAAGAGASRFSQSGTFALPDTGTGGGSFVIPDAGPGGFPLPEDIRNLLNGFPPATTTKPPLRVTAPEDHNKIFSSGVRDSEVEAEEHLALVDDAHLILDRDTRQFSPVKGGGGARAIPQTKRGCNSKPEAPANGRMDCSSYTGCRSVCFSGYRFPTGERRLFLQCDDGQWVVTGGAWDHLPDCQPVCNPECQNNGICLAPNTCQCPDNWEGPSCETPKAPQPRQCSSKPPTPANSKIFCGRDECTARCHEGYHFEEGTTRLSYQCLDGQWVVRQARWAGTSPDCQPICDPACVNGGRCIAPNVCECTPEYRGDHCQYPISNCDPKKLGFNGGYNCSGEGMDFGCALWCPEEVQFEFPSAERYTCDYATSVWSPSPIPNCDYASLLGAAGLEDYGTPSLPQVPDEFPHEPIRKVPGTCFVWSGSHYKTFDGKVYSFESSCPHTLLQDSTHGTFSVNLRSDPTAGACPEPPTRCHREIQLFLEDDQYLLRTSEEAGGASLEYHDTSLAIPGQMNGVVWERIAHFVVIRVAGLGLTLKWDMQSLVVVEVSEMLWNRTGGLCGQRDERKDNDWSLADGTPETSLTAFLQAWQATTVGERCLDQPQTRHPCGRSPSPSADTFCNKLRNDRRFARCREKVDVEAFINACRWDYCGCEDRERGKGETCSCQTFAAFFRECTSQGVEVAGGWRSEDLCPMQCEVGKVYNPCMPAIQPRCGQPAESERPEFCVEGCDCPSGLVLLHGDSCIPTSECPCTYRNKEYQPGATIPNDCNSCTCVGGEWVCTETKCGSRCAVVGDPHYTTFDGRRYDFMGHCNYYLVRGDRFTVEAENTPCAGAISESMNFPASLVNQFPSCTKSVTVRLEGMIIKLKQGREVTVNGVELRQLPAWVNGAYIKTASSLFIMVELSNGLDIWWDGETRVYIDAPPEFRGETSGLCGTFTDNQRDDFLTPQGDVEQNPVAFANKWKTSERCPDLPLTDEVHPCERHVQNKAVAERLCAKLKSSLFARCHLEVDPEPYYRDCLYDMCSCETKLDGCLCPQLAAYSKECTRKGIIIDWRAEVRECGVHCTGGQRYQVCGNSCGRTCMDLATNVDCKKKCVEGCNCLDGFSLDSDGLCVPVTECPCIYEGKEYKPGYEMLQPQSDGTQRVCECFNAGWNCWDPNPGDLETSQPQVICSADGHLTYTECLPEEERTCQTMHMDTMAGELCRPGCVCEEGFVRNVDTGECIPHNQCPCHHGGRSYREGSTITEDCNTCTCEGGMWLCTEEDCPALCTAWGDSHYKTFDGRLYEFHGTCDYLLAKGKASRADTFEVTIQNVPCGTDGVTCAKSVTLRVGTGEEREVVQFSRNKPPPTRNMTRTIIREAGVFVFAEVADMGLVLQWDKGTRTYLRLSPTWQGKVRGLCGNYNGDDQDDFQTPSGGSSEVSVRIFGDSWRLQNYCPDSILINDTCAHHPHRKVWAAEKCAVLKSPQFAHCHSEVPVEQYIERCQFDACGCNQGGDCECLCTAISAYAHECSIHGVHIRWRTPELCPMQCDESCEHYEPCIPTCPQETCDTLLDPTPPLCTQDACVEGCAKNVCPPDQVYKSLSDQECVPKVDCEKKCMEIDGEVFMEGDLISQDDCHTCTCSRKKKICRGTPCPTTPTPTTSTSASTPTTPSAPALPPRLTTPPPPPEMSTTPPEEWEGVCRSGWTEWISENKPIVFRQNSDRETVPEKLTQPRSTAGFCARSQIVDIRCRSVGTQRPYTEQVGVTCNLEEGLRCQGPRDASARDTCWDYEVAFLCDCSLTTPEPTITTTTPATPATPPPIITPVVPPVTPPPRLTCEDEGWTPWFNTNFPNTDGEFEYITEIRKTNDFCPDHYISEVECRPVQGGETEPFVTCDKSGVRCRNNVGELYCQDYEVRVMCQCECQDGLGLEDWSIPNDRISASTLLTPDDQPHAARLNADWAWTAAGLSGPEEEWLQVDLEEVKEVTGVVTQGHPYLEQYLSAFGIQYSDTGTAWQDIREPDVAYSRQFIGNSDSSTPVINLFPEPVYARYIRIIPIDYHGAISLRLELKGCDKQVSTLPPYIFSPLPTVTGPPQCVNGWTEWMNTHTPSPKNWDDMDDLRSLSAKYTFCEAHQIVDTECQVVGMELPADAVNQYGIVCNTNNGLQCNDDLQAPDHCYDYGIRFFCDCSLTTTTAEVPPPLVTTSTTLAPPPGPVETTLTPGPPEVEECTYADPQIKEHRTDCRKFHECAPTADGRVYITKECGPGTFFSPNNLVCDYEYNVLLEKPECLIPPPEATITTTPSPTTLQPCTGDYWTEWFNVSHPGVDNGDFETFEKIRELGYELCDDMHIKDIHCQFYKKQESSPGRGAKGRGKGGRKGRKGGGRRVLDRITSQLVSYEGSDDQYVECSTANGLVCRNYQQGWGGECQDYAIRVLCSCEATRPTTTTPPSTTPYEDIRNVTVLTTPYTTDNTCKVGYRYDPQAIRCDSVCHYYRAILAKMGICWLDSQYAPGCVDVLLGQACPPGQYLVDKDRCVSRQDCNCYLPNGMSAPPGRGFQVEDCEKCQCTSNQLRCDTSSCVTTVPPGVTVTSPLIFKCDNTWSSWVSLSEPGPEGNEQELITDLRLTYPKLCRYPQRIQCRVKGSQQTPEEAGQKVNCTRRTGLQCARSENSEDCKDYEVRFLCVCKDGSSVDQQYLTLSTTTPSPVTTSITSITPTEYSNVTTPVIDECLPGTHYEECAMPCQRVCMYHTSILRQHGYCLVEGDCAPGCKKDSTQPTCSQGYFMLDQHTCVTIEQCTCSLPNGNVLQPGVWHPVGQCQMCMCHNNEVECQQEPDCVEETTYVTEEYTTRVTEEEITTTAPTTVATYPTVTLPTICDSWSPFYKKEERDTDGVILSLAELRTRKEFLCENPINATCREATTFIPAMALGQTLTCDAEEGLRCLNLDNSQDCHNYEISFYCDCGGAALTTPAPGPTLGPTTTLIPCDAWSPWINNVQPWQSDGDTEFKTIQQLREEYQFCLEGQLADIECVVAGTEQTSRADQGTSCDINYGFRCTNAQQLRGVCLDYKIRYYCTCETTPAPTTTTTLVPETATPPSICDPSKYINLLTDVEDRAFSSTPARNSRYGPASARLYNEYGGLTTMGWSPAVNDGDQFLEVDLGSVVPVYGVVVAGNPLTRERVTALTVQYSRDALTWTPLTQDPSNPSSPPRILQGPYNPAEPLKQMFPRPVELRYIRLQPTRWQRAIALRFDVIGCSLPTTAPVWTPEPPKCVEKMGVENGQLSDLQITVSSVYNDQEDFFGKQNIRLHTEPMTYLSAGAWVAKPKPDQFVRFDLVEPRILSGVVTQGRGGGAEEWVETFIVRYSHDGKTWTTLMDEDGSNKVFVANYDGDSPVENKFDKLLETRFLEIQPLTWHNNIALRTELLGCYHPYPEVTTTPVPPETSTAPPPSYCAPCPGLPDNLYDYCFPCGRGEMFDGETCIKELDCPCYKDGNKYEFGSVFETRECEECECLLDGEVRCAEKECPPCEDEDEQAVLTPSCGCVCKPCPEGTQLCPTNNYCLDLENWCDGVEQCPDDEVGCPTTTPAIPEACPTPFCPEHWEITVQASKGPCPSVKCEPPVITTPVPCEMPLCPPAYTIIVVPKKGREVCPSYECAPPAPTEPTPCDNPTCPPGYKVKEADYIDYLSQEYSEQQSQGAGFCIQYECVTEEPPTESCPPPQCPAGYEIFFADSKVLLDLCPEFECVPLPTTTLCPPVQCPPDLQTMYIQSGELTTCPQYTCVKVTTPAPTTTPVPETTQCQPMVMPICKLKEEFYLTNPNDPCPVFDCKPVGGTLPPITEMPRKMTPECRVEGSTFTTFSDNNYELQPCNHMLARDKLAGDWSISVHGNCTRGTKCGRYLNITMEGKQLLLKPDLTVDWNNHTYSVTQAQRIGTTTNTFTISRVGNSIYFESTVHSFTVQWNALMNVNITVMPLPGTTVEGLCGLHMSDETVSNERTKPDGSLANSVREFGEAWALEGDACKPKPKCPVDMVSQAFELCNRIQSEPFTECHSSVDPSPFMKSCVDTMCTCLVEAGEEETEESAEKCRCQALTRYVTSCLENNPEAQISDWRIVTKCYEECGPGEVYQDCYRAHCEQRCETLHSAEGTRCLEESGSCTPGCFCSPGLVRKGGRCVAPEMCRDCVCEGYGDPHYTTFDRRNYTFNGECSYVAARDKDPRGQHEFQVITRSKQCTMEPVTMCTVAVTILYGSHEVFMETLPTGGVGVKVDGGIVDTFPHRDTWLALEQPDTSQVMAAVTEIQLEVTYFLDNSGFAVRLPSRRYFNKTEGLCGNCNHDPDDDFQTRSSGLTENFETFGRSWLQEGESESSCGVLDKESLVCIPIPPDEDPCLIIMDEDKFGKCHPVEDPVAYVSACQLDAWCGSREPQVAACHSLEAYARRCADLDICLDWRSEELCPKTCTGGQEYQSCGPGCVSTCDNYEELKLDPQSCPLSSVDGCFCPLGTVLDEGQCVNESACQTCDDEGHRFGDVWQTDPCTTCQCTEWGSSTCSTRTCPADPICDEGYKVVEVRDTWDDCCGLRKKCELDVPECPEEIVKPVDTCSYGQHLKLIKALGVCPQYACVCLEPEDCPVPVVPADRPLKPGEKWDLDSSGCCERYTASCTGKCPEVSCPLYYTLEELPLRQDECCPETRCEPPTDACIYDHKYYIDSDGFEQPLTPSDPPVKKLYRVNETWEDGLCQTCHCVGVQGEETGSTSSAHCSQQTCPPLSAHPDHGEYRLESAQVPGSCCPEVVRTACIDDYEEIEVGETLEDPFNGCRSVECVRSSDKRVEKREKIFSCDEECPAGWEYEPSPLYPQQCCGQCVQVACVVEGEVKAVGESWESDDQCTTYTCYRDNKNQIQVQAVELHCSAPSDEELQLYTFDTTNTLGQCCPIYTRTACLLGDITIPAGESTQDPQDSCATISCRMSEDGNVTRRERETTCDMQCDQGSSYMPPAPESNECCGKCVKTHCVDNGNIYAIGQRWQKEDDICYEYSCELRDDVFVTVAVKRECPYFDPQCPPEERYMDELGCCQLCNVTVTPKRDCQPKLVPPQETVGLFQLSTWRVGTCKNPDPVPNFRQCSGHCESFTQFQGKSRHAKHVSTCFCCKPSRFEKIRVMLQCDSGVTFSPVYDNIAECECLACSNGGTPEYVGDEPILDDTEFFSLSDGPVDQ